MLMARPGARTPSLQLSDERDAAIVPIGNLVPDSVPVDDDEVGGGAWTRRA